MGVWLCQLAFLSMGRAPALLVAPLHAGLMWRLQSPFLTHVPLSVHPKWQSLGLSTDEHAVSAALFPFQSDYNCPCRNGHTMVQKQDPVVRAVVRFSALGLLQCGMWPANVTTEAANLSCGGTFAGQEFS